MNDTIPVRHIRPMAAESIRCPRIYFFDQRSGAGLRETSASVMRRSQGTTALCRSRRAFIFHLALLLLHRESSLLLGHDKPIAADRLHRFVFPPGQVKFSSAGRHWVCVLIIRGVSSNVRSPIA